MYIGVAPAWYRCFEEDGLAGRNKYSSFEQGRLVWSFNYPTSSMLFLVASAFLYLYCLPDLINLREDRD